MLALALDEGETLAEGETLGDALELGLRLELGLSESEVDEDGL